MAASDARGAAGGHDEAAWDDDARVAELRAAVAAQRLLEGWPHEGGPVDDDFYRRMLRARSGLVDKAARLVGRYVAWRTAFTPAYPRPLQLRRVARSVAAAKAYVWPHRDKLGRVCAIVHANRHIASDCPEAETEAFIVYMLDDMVRRMSGEQQQFVALFDLAGFGRANVDISAVKAIVRILSVGYPERLGAIWVVNEGWLFWTVWKVVSPFIDARTTAKIHMLGGRASHAPKLLEWWDAEALPRAYGGANAQPPPTGEQLLEEARAREAATASEGADAAAPDEEAAATGGAGASPAGDLPDDASAPVPEAAAPPEPPATGVDGAGGDGHAAATDAPADAARSAAPSGGAEPPTAS